MSSCTVVTTATGGRCGDPAVASRTSRLTGEWLHECTKHDTRPGALFAALTGPRGRNVVR